MDIFLDYYHPYAGVCNQLYLITNHIYEAYKKDIRIFIHKFNVDIFKKNRVPVSEVLDLVATNEKLKKLTGKNLILFDKPEKYFIPELCVYTVSNIEILNCLEFNRNVLEKVYQIKGKMNGYSGIHFRLDVDCVIHYLFETSVYDNFMGKCNNSPSEAQSIAYNLMKNPKVICYCDFLLNQYTTFIKELGVARTWYICTPIKKYSIHNHLIGYLDKLTDFIISGGGKVVISEKNSEFREIDALIDLLVLRDSEKMIGFEGSSYSEGYCFKVNSIRKSIKEFRFVNGIIPKIKYERN